eukprot:3886359-Rhodomonas_salina.1
MGLLSPCKGNARRESQCWRCSGFRENSGPGPEAEGTRMRPGAQQPSISLSASLPLRRRQDFRTFRPGMRALALVFGAYLRGVPTLSPPLLA